MHRLSRGSEDIGLVEGGIGFEIFFTSTGEAGLGGVGGAARRISRCNRTETINAAMAVRTVNLQGEVIQEPKVLRLVGQVGLNLRRGVMGGIREMDGSFVCVGHCELFSESLLPRENPVYKYVNRGRARKRCVLGIISSDKVGPSRVLHSGWPGDLLFTASTLLRSTMEATTPPFRNNSSP